MAVKKRDNTLEAIRKSVSSAMGVESAPIQNEEEQEEKLEGIYIRVTKVEKERIAKKAKRNGMKLATYVRFVALSSSLGEEEKNSPFS